MWKICIALSMTLVSFGSGCEPREPGAGSNISEGKLIYFRDSRVDVCYAYVYEQHSFYKPHSIYEQRNGGKFAHGGPGLATVPCEKVDKFLSDPPINYLK